MLEITVRSSHIDMFGHVNNARYIEFLEWDRVQMTADQGIDLLAMAAEGLGPAVVRMEINYRLEARIGEVLLLDSQPIELKNDKVGVIKQTVTNKKSGKIICDAMVTFVMIDLRQRKSVPMPEAMKKFFPKKS